MSKDIELDIMERMRGKGATYQQIADALGVSKQAVHERMGNNKRNRRRYYQIFNDCPYEGLRKFMLDDEQMNITKLINIMGYSSTASTRGKIERMVNGSNVSLTINGILRLEEASGVPFSELFKRADAQ